MVRQEPELLKFTTRNSHYFPYLDSGFRKAGLPSRQTSPPEGVAIAAGFRTTQQQRRASLCQVSGHNLLKCKLLPLPVPSFASLRHARVSRTGKKTMRKKERKLAEFQIVK